MLTALQEHQPHQVSIWQDGFLGPEDNLAYEKQALNYSTGWNGRVVLDEETDQHFPAQESGIS